MRKYRWVLIICLILITFLGVIPRPVSGFHYVHYWRTRFAGSVVVGGNMSYPIDPFWRYYGNQSWQTSEQLWFEMYLNNLSIRPVNIDQDSDGNPQLVLNLTSNLYPSDILTWNEEWLFTVSDLRPNLPHIIIDQSGIIDDIPELIGAEAYHQYTRGTTLWKTWNNSLIELAVSLQNNLPAEQRTNVLALIFQAVSWIQANISIPTGITEPQYPEETINSTWGDCDDLSNLLIALLRIYGIPSYLMTGHWYQEGASTTGFIWGSVPQDAYWFVDWRNVVGHGWAMVYVPPWGWLPFDIAANPQATDPTQAYYESLYARGIPMVNLWRIVASDYIEARRLERDALFQYQLREVDIEEWTIVGSIPILDVPYLVTNIATLIALTVTLAIFSCFVGFALRRQSREESE